MESRERFPGVFSWGGLTDAAEGMLALYAQLQEPRLIRPFGSGVMVEASWKRACIIVVPELAICKIENEKGGRILDLIWRDTSGRFYGGSEPDGRDYCSWVCRIDEDDRPIVLECFNRIPGRIV